MKKIYINKFLLSISLLSAFFLFPLLYAEENTTDTSIEDNSSITDLEDKDYQSHESDLFKMLGTNQSLSDDDREDILNNFNEQLDTVSKLGDYHIQAARAMADTEKSRD